MTNLSTLALLSTTSILLATGAAQAEPSVTQAATTTTPPATGGVEISFGTVYSQGTGKLGGGLPSVEDVAGPGTGIETSVGWRATPRFSIGGYATLSAYRDSDVRTSGAVSLAAGIKADWHFRPSASFDPWISVGTGLKFLGIEDGDNDRALTGLELAKLEVGADYRISPDLTIGPVVGASATMFRHQYADKTSDDAMEIANKQVNWTFSVGVLGRFGIGGR